MFLNILICVFLSFSYPQNNFLNKKLINIIVFQEFGIQVESSFLIN